MVMMVGQGTLFFAAWKLGVESSLKNALDEHMQVHKPMEVPQAPWTTANRASSHKVGSFPSDHKLNSTMYTLDNNHLEQLVKSLQLKLDDAWVSETPSLFAKEEFKDLDIPEFQARVPAVVYHKETILAFCEARFDTVMDWGNMMISLRRGKLTGQDVTWERIRLIAGIPGHRTMNPTPIVDHKKNAIVLVFSAFPTNMTFFDLVKRRGKRLSRVYVIKSYDVGLTWTDPVEITNQTIGKMKPFPVLYAPGPGHSIQMKSGRLIVPGNFFTTERRRSISGMCSDCTNLASIIYSDDGGITWHLGAETNPAKDARGARIYPNEAQLAEVEDGTLYMNLRTLDGVQPRAYCYSYDGGQSLTPVQLHPTLVEPGYRKKNNVWKPTSPGGCQGSVIAVNFGSPSQRPTSQQKWLVFSNPADPLSRVNLGIRVSADRGSSWSNPWIIFPYKAGYSDMVYIETTVAGKPVQYFAIIFEGGSSRFSDHVKFRMFNIEALIQNILKHETNERLHRRPSEI
ncbi:sialidase-3-like isoform X2 [Patiria miniata]|uniref:Sialidase domain-containing protein n=1 Tax=Patiria miniata TaxID=46514 RepID=A0A913ZB34_PATMI|nr:sialidase-3-like isoform X2 [Patiria miniata]